MQTSAREQKISEIYLSSSQHGKGLGMTMLAHAKARARTPGCNTITLFVNRRNDLAVTSYRKSGFVVTDEMVFDIGNGFDMDDYRMEKSLTTPIPATR